ncbi:hypothetical protein D3C81_770410 [compost metagenome]
MKGRRKKRDAQWECLLRYREEARPVKANPSANPKRFFGAASTRGILLEPAGPLAGPQMDRAHKLGPRTVGTGQRP